LRVGTFRADKKFKINVSHLLYIKWICTGKIPGLISHVQTKLFEIQQTSLFLIVLTTASTFHLVLVGYCAVSTVYYSEQNVEIGRRIYF